MNILKVLVAVLVAVLPLKAVQHTIGGDTIVNATNGVANALVQTAAKTAQTNYTATNVVINFAQAAYWSNTSPALRFTLTNIPASTTEDRCVITLIGTIGAQLTNVIDSITWLGPWGVLNAQSNVIMVRWSGGRLWAWQDPMHGVTTPAQWVANTDNFDAGVADEVRASSDAARNLTGIVGRPGGQYLVFENVGAFTITLKNSVTSTATNQFLLNADLPVLANQSVGLVYDLVSSRWRAIGVGSSSGAGAPTGTMVSSGASITGGIPIATDATDTNFIGSKVTITLLTNINTGSIVVSNATVSRFAIIAADGSVSNSPTSSTLTLVTDSAAQTLTNKRITPRVATLTDAATVTPDVDSFDGGKLTALSQDSTIANPTGTPTAFQNYKLRIKSTTARALTWGSQYRGSFDLTLPSTTTGTSHTDYFVFQYNSDDTKWDLVGKNFGF